MAKIEEAAVAYNIATFPVEHHLPKLTESEAHRIAMRTPITTVVSELETVLSRSLAAFTVGIKDPKTLARWSSEPQPKIRQLTTERRLRAAYQVVSMLRPWEDDSTIRAWFVGMNPVLADSSVAEAIRTDRVRDAMDAAHEFIGNG